MAKLVQQSTANDPLFFFLVLSSDHVSPATGKSPTVTISKNGAAFGAPSGAVTEIANGWYQVAGNATDTNTLGDILLHATEASSDNCDLVAAQVIAVNPRSTGFGLVNASANVAQWNGSNVAAPASAGIPDVNVKNYNNQTAATDAANNLPKVDVEDWHNVAVGALPTNFSSLAIDGNGNVSITSNVKKNTAQSAFAFVMTDSTTHAPKTGVVVTATRSIDGAAFGACANAVSEIANGWYTIALAAADVNGNDIALRFTGASADDCDIKFKTQP